MDTLEAQYLDPATPASSRVKYILHLHAHWAFLTIQWILVYSKSCTTIIAVNFRIFSSPPKETAAALGITPHFTPVPPPQPEALLDALSLDLPVLDISYNEIMPYVVVCNWLLALSIMFSDFTHAVVCVSASLLLIAE